MSRAFFFGGLISTLCFGALLVVRPAFAACSGTCENNCLGTLSPPCVGASACKGSDCTDCTCRSVTANPPFCMCTD
jgi:hypothetical protein